MAVPPGQVGIYVSEAVADLYGARTGVRVCTAGRCFAPGTTFFVAGVWRDYARQSGAIVMAQPDFERLTGDRRVNDLALWLAPGADARGRRSKPGAPRGAADVGATGGRRALLEFASAGEIRATSLRIFDRSFAVTYWLQAVAIAHRPVRRGGQLQRPGAGAAQGVWPAGAPGPDAAANPGVVAGEGAAWTLIGSLAGLALGLAVSVVLVHVVNPQSFHWTMDLAVPWLRLGLALCAGRGAGRHGHGLAGRAARRPGATR
jgi:putative ABC transport system permease protein